jgi:hypothetical protein
MGTVRARRWAALVAVGCVAALAPATVGFDAVGAVVGLARPGQATNNTVTTSTRHTTTIQRVDLEDAPPPECDFPGAPASQVEQTSTELEPVITLRETIGPQDIFIGPDESVPHFVPDGVSNIDVLTTYETVVTQYFQATAAGEACAVVASAARFTG